MGKYFNFILQMIITAIIGAIIWYSTDLIIGKISNSAGVGFGSVLSSLIAIGYFMWAMAINPGQEEFLTSIPQVILGLATIELIRTFIPELPNLTIPFGWIGIAFGLGSVFLSNMIVKKYVIKNA